MKPKTRKEQYELIMKFYYEGRLVSDLHFYPVDKLETI